MVRFINDGSTIIAKDIFIDTSLAPTDDDTNDWEDNTGLVNYSFSRSLVGDATHDIEIICGTTYTWNWKIGTG